MKVPGWITTFFLILLGIVPEAVGGYYNHLNQRTRAAQAEGTHWKYGYDSLGQVTSGKKYWNDGTPVAGQQFEYAFDELASQARHESVAHGCDFHFANRGGNRLETGAGGDGAGGGLRYANYTPNGRNGYATREVPGAVDVYGAVNPAAEIAINGSTNVYRRNEYYHGTVTVDNSAGPVYQAISTTATLGSSQSIHQETFVPQSLVTNAYDLDGNLLSDGVWTNKWDAENRLIQAERIASAPAAAKLQLKFSYDFQGRRIHKRVFAWNSGAGAYNGAASTETKFVYDGWNLLAELSSNNSVVRSYLWGLDTVGHFAQESGAGALALVKIAGGSSYFPVYDDLGNVSALVDATTGETEAWYDYGPFGEGIQAWGAAAAACPFRFSTKYLDAETGFVYYGYRFYDPSVGRWLNHDPIEEEGGLNLYQAFFNAPTDYVDVDGLQNVPIRPAPRNPRQYQYTRSFSYNYRGELLQQTLNPAQRTHRDQFYMRQWMRDMANPIPPNQAVIRQGWTPEMAPKPSVTSFTFCSFSGQNSIPNLSFSAQGGIGPVLKGQEGVARAMAAYEAAGGKVLGQQISIRAGGGRTIPDFYGQNAQGIREFIEVKNGPGAALNAIHWHPIAA